MFIEPTDKEEFQQAMEQYYAMVNDATANGAIFCGVCRGKVISFVGVFLLLLCSCVVLAFYEILHVIFYSR